MRSSGALIVLLAAQPPKFRSRCVKFRSMFIRFLDVLAWDLIPLSSRDVLRL